VAELKIQARGYRRERGKLVAVVVVLLDGNPLHADTVVLDLAEQRAAFCAAVRDRLNGECALADDLDRRLVNLLLDTHAAEERAEAADVEGRASQADRLVQLAEAAVLFHDPAGDCYARVPIGGHVETWPLRSTGFRRWLTGEFWQRYEKAPSGEAFTNARAVLEAQAQFRGPCFPVFLRVAPDGQGGIYLDLGDAAWQAVHVTLRGWEVVAQPAVCFRRSNGMGPLPLPQQGGTLEDLRPLVNLPGAEHDEAWALVKGWLVGTGRPRGPYPGLALYGEQGAAKTTTARVLRGLVDPASPDLRSEPRELRDLAIAARNCWVVALDNVSHIQPWLSDALCRLATGGGWATRELYTDLDEVLFDAQRPVLLTGITEYLTRPDLRDRTEPITLPAIPRDQRRPEKRMWAEFEQARPRLLGALLDSVAGALRHEPRVRLHSLPRMADYAVWAVAAERGRGDAPIFLSAYTNSRDASHQQSLDASIIGPALVAFLPGATDLGPWEGTASDLLEALSSQVDDRTKRSKYWPKSPLALSNEIRRLASALRGLNYDVRFGVREAHTGRRLIRIEQRPPPDDPPPEEDGAQASPSSPTSPATELWRNDAPSDDGPGDAGDASPSSGDDPADRSVTGESAPEQGAETPGDAGDAGDGRAAASAGRGYVADDYTVLTTPADVEAALPALIAAPALGIDVETTGLDPLRDRLRLVQLATPTHTYLLDCFQCDPRVLAPVLDQARRLLGHNLKFDLRFLMAAGLDVPEGARLFDTMLAAQLLGAGTEDGYLNRCGLAAVVERVLGQTLDKGAQTSDWSGPLDDAQYAYAARDAAILLPLAERLDAALAAADLTTIAEVEMRALPAVAWLEQTGAPFDAEAWADLSDAAVAEQVRLEYELTALTGTENLFGDATINWGSPAKVLGVLQARGHGIQDTIEATLLALADQEPLARLLLAHREASRKASVYGIEMAAKYVSPRTGRIHADYLQLGSRAGRMSCQRPNLQQVPRERAYRACFRPAPGRVLVKADYSQIELRIAAEITGDTRMLAAYQQGQDLHVLTAAAVLKKPVEAVDAEARQLAKALNFGLAYGMGAATLREHAASGYGVRLTEPEAQQFRAAFFRAYPGLKRWHRSQPDGAVETRTLAGRRRLGVARFTEKLNSPVQGTGADGLKLALALLWERRAECPSAVPVLCVHDEIVIECAAEAADAARAWIKTAMRDGMQPWLPRVPVVVEAQVGTDWSMKR
jgi:DNA polymerase I-like protein with 3'-5' exonuclease and polymerase domains